MGMNGVDSLASDRADIILEFLKASPAGFLSGGIYLFCKKRIFIATKKIFSPAKLYSSNP